MAIAQLLTNLIDPEMRIMGRPHPPRARTRTSGADLDASFREWWRELRSAVLHGGRRLDTAMRQRMQAAMERFRPAVEEAIEQETAPELVGSPLYNLCRAKPRTFISSTCFDFADARASIAQHLKQLGHEPLRSDSVSFGVSLGKHPHNAYLDQVETSDYLVLLIGGRHGGTFVGSEKSITNEEYRHALKKHIPVIAFVNRNVNDARPLSKRTRALTFPMSLMTYGSSISST